MTTFQQAADALDPGRMDLETLMRRIVTLAEGNVRLRTRVRTGTLRRSWTNAVERGGRRGIVGTNVGYALHQVNDPLREGAEDSYDDILAMLEAFGIDYFSGVVR